MKFKLILSLLISLISFTASACVCGNEILTKEFQRAKLVAKIKILTMTQDTVNRDYHDADIEMLDLYKGQRLEKIKIMTALNSSCSFLPTVGSTWLIFASVWNNKLSFNSCTGRQLDREFDSVKYPNAKENHTASSNRKLEVLEFLTNNNITNPNPANLWIYGIDLAKTKGIKNKNRFAVFKFQVNQDLSIAKIKALRTFRNGALNRISTKAIANLKFKKTPLTEPTEVTIVLYYYDDKPSLVSIYDH